MSVSTVLLIFALGCVMVAVVASLLITAYLDKRGIKTPFLLLRLFVFRNLFRYKEITVTETESIGPLFYLYVVPINIALLLVIAAFFV